jgi:hypothetical protein
LDEQRIALNKKKKKKIVYPKYPATMSCELHIVMLAVVAQSKREKHLIYVLAQARAKILPR